MTFVLFVSLSLMGQDNQEGMAPIGRDFECGLYCLHMSLSALELPVGTFAVFRKQVGRPSALGYSMLELKHAAEAAGAHTLALEMAPRDLVRVQRPFACIALVADNHFVNVYDIHDGAAHIVDFPRSYSLPLDTLTAVWSGPTLLVSNGPIVILEANIAWWPVLLCGALAICLVAGLVGRRWLRAAT